MITRLLIFLAFAINIIAAACSAGQRSADDRQPVSSGDTTYVENPRTLADILVREPGVSIRGGSISIRGQGPPLFVIDGTPVGQGYANAASAINVEDVARVEVLKQVSETLQYGRRGANGVILIYTR